MSKISWTNTTKNPLVGCSKISAGCANCYAATAAATPRLQQFQQYQGVVGQHKNWTGQINFVPNVLDQIRRLTKPQKIFMCSMSDMFHKNVEHEWLIEIWRCMRDCQHLTFQVLTKRPRQMLEFTRWLSRHESLGDNWNSVYGHVWLGTSVENQNVADERIPVLAQVQAKVRFLSCEPLLEDINLKLKRDRLQWVIVGGESGSGARGCAVSWIRSVVEQCQVAHVPVWVKQTGAAPIMEEGQNPSTFSAAIKCDRKGEALECLPDELKVREFPRYKREI